MVDINSEVALFQDTVYRLEDRLSQVIVGNNKVVRLTLCAIFGGGHALLEGAPGLGKTLLVNSISRLLGLSFKRIQFTPDLMPSDVTGTQVIQEDETGKRNFVFKAGPIFTNMVLADEINRATPKTQSSLLEAMEERQVSVFDSTYRLPRPFFVLATQNPVELEGTYPLPEAQLDRFLLKITVPLPTGQMLKEILKRTTGAPLPPLEPVFSDEEGAEIVIRMQRLVREVVISDTLIEVLTRFLSALTPGDQFATELTNKYVRFGPGPRGGQSVIITAKVLALMDGRINVALEDIKAALLPALRHRLILNFQAEADGVDSDRIINQLKQAK